MDTVFGFIFNLPKFAQILLFVVLFAVGIFVLIRGADFFVNGSSDIAKRMKISPMIIGLTIVSIGTSLPETAVSVTAVLSGSPDIAISNVVGSVTANLLLVLGATFLLTKICCDRQKFSRDILVMTGSGILLLVFALTNFTAHGSSRISRIEAGIFFALFVLYILWIILNERKNKKDLKFSVDAQKQALQSPAETEKVENAESKVSKKLWISICLVLVGAVGVFLGGEFVVFGAKNIATSLGLSETLVGLTIVAVGTSLPELVTSLVATKRGENEMAIGNVVGSNIFNILFIIGLAGVCKPIAVSTDAVCDIAIMTAFVVLFSTLFFIFSAKKKDFGKSVGITFLSLYTIYIIFAIVRTFVF